MDTLYRHMPEKQQIKSHLWEKELEALLLHAEVPTSLSTPEQAYIAFTKATPTHMDILKEHWIAGCSSSSSSTSCLSALQKSAELTGTWCTSTLLFLIPTPISSRLMQPSTPDIYPTLGRKKIISQATFSLSCLLPFFLKSHHHQGHRACVRLKFPVNISFNLHTAARICVIYSMSVNPQILSIRLQKTVMHCACTVPRIMYFSNTI